MDRPTSTRAIELETKIGFLERTVEDLNEVVLAQGREIERLTARLTVLEARLAAGQEERAGDAALDPLSERPPHY